MSAQSCCVVSMAKQKVFALLQERGAIAVQVIIVPIFWNKKADEKETVIAAAQQVLQQLQELGIEAGLDDTNADTPGQKYRYW